MSDRTRDGTGLGALAPWMAALISLCQSLAPGQHASKPLCHNTMRRESCLLATDPIENVTAVIEGGGT